MSAARIEVLTALRDRLAKAAGASVELDVRLWLALFDKQVLVIDDRSERFPRPHRHVSARSLWSADWPHWSDRSQVEGAARELECPAYTASIDAAVTLVPEGHAWAANWEPIFDAHMRGDVSIFTPDAAYEWQASAHTVPLALCLARVLFELADIAEREA